MTQIDSSKREKKLSKKDEKSHEKSVQYFSFRLDNEFYAMAVEHIREVIEYEAVHPVPKVPPYVAGVMNLRGDVIPVLDLTYLFHEKPGKISNFSCIIIVEVIDKGETREVGVIIDAINSVLNLTPSQIMKTPEFGLKIRQEYVSGIGKVNDDIILLLNIQRVLNLDELSDF